MKNKDKIFGFLFKYAGITLGCLIYSVGVALFLDANRLAAGGVTGIAIIINHLTGWNTGLLIALINIPLFVAGAVFFGKKFIISTIYATLLSSALIAVWGLSLEAFLPLTENLLIASVVGGALYGAGLGLVFRMGGTTGGTDIIVKVLRKKFRHIKTGVVSMLIDAVIVTVSAFIYKDFELIFYTAVSIVLFTVTFDWVLYGGNAAKFVYIVTSADKSAEMCDMILKELDISATLVDGKGAYSGSDRVIILCAVKNILFPKLRDVIRETDPRAFTIVTSAQEIYGEGYKDNGEEDL